MRIGHAAFALVAKRARPAVPIAYLMTATYMPDIIDALLDVMHRSNRQLTHSLPSMGVAATLMALIAFAIWKDGRDALAVGVLYLSHWPADYLTGLKPTWPGGPDVGLEWYRYTIPETILEIAISAVCLAIYRWRSPIARGTRPIS